ncbi:MAG: hypothetical protein ACHQ7M_13030 [Chloroflexota bacterium]
MAIDLDERRRRRDERMAVATANEIVQQAASRGRAITIEWAALAALPAAGVGLDLAARYRHLAPASLGTAAWAGFVLGALLCNAGLEHGRARLASVGLAIFAGLPVAALPFYFVPPDRAMAPLLGIAGLGAALFGGALRWGWDLRASLGESLALAKDGLGRGSSAFVTWLHDAMLKCIFALFLLAAGSAVAYVGRQQQRELLFWAGGVIVFLIGTVGLWAPGLYHRGKLIVSLRHCGQLCFWLSLILAPFLEQGPNGNLPYNNAPSLRFIAMGLGLTIVGVTWFLQKGSVFGHQAKPQPKPRPERGYSLALLILGLMVVLAGADLRQRVKLTVDQSVVSETNALGAVHFEPAAQVKSLLIVQPLENVPIYLDEVQFQDGVNLRLIPMLYPGEQRNPDDHGLVKAVRSAAQLNVQSFPEKRVELWSRGDAPRG